MASIGTLVGFLRLDDAQYQRALKSASNQTRQFAAGLTSAFLRIAGPAALAASVVALGKRALDTADRFDNLAKRINASFEGVQVLETLGKDFGANADLFTGAADRLQKSLAELKAGLPGAARDFATLGLSFEQLAGLKLERQLELIGRAIASAHDQEAAFLATTRILGANAAPELKQALISLGVEGYEKLAERTRKSVGLMSEETAKRLAEASRHIQDFRDKLTITIGEIIGGAMGAINRTPFDQQIEYVQDRVDTLARLTADQAARYGAQARAGLAREVFVLSELVVDSTDKATEAQINAAQAWLRHLAGVLDQAGDLDEQTANRIRANAEFLNRQLQRLLDARTAEEEKAAAERLRINQAAAEAASEEEFKARLAAARKLRVDQILDNAIRRAQEKSKDTADETERAARAARSLASGYSAAADAAQRIELPAGSRPDRPRGPTPPNPQGSGMTNQEWRVWYRNNPDAGDQYRSENQRLDPNSNRAQRPGPAMATPQALPTPQAMPTPQAANPFTAVPATPPVGSQPTVVPSPAPDETARGLGSLITEVAGLVKALTTIGDKLVVA